MAAPRQHLLRLSVVSTIFPQLSNSSRRSFRLGLALLILALIAFAVLGWEPPLITTIVFGLPVLFLAYLDASGAGRDLPIRWLLRAGGTGAALGVVWGLVSGKFVAGAYDVGLSTGLTTGNLLLDGLVIPISGSMLMLVPTVLVRMSRPRDRRSMDGFVIGWLGAIFFAAGSTMARLAPQLATGPTIDHQPISVLFVEAGLRGLLVPLTAGAAGALVGIALWFTPRARKAVLAAVLLTVVVYGAMGMLEMATITDDMQLALHLVFPAVMLLALRLGIQAALLNEAQDAATATDPVLCAHCSHVIPDMPFCPRCGGAARASSRVSQAARVAARAPSPDAVQWPGYALPPGSYSAILLPRNRYRPLLLSLAVGLGATAMVATVISIAISPAKNARYDCPPDCGRPPMGKPVEANPRFSASNGEFSVSYPRGSSAYNVDTDPNGVVLNYLNGDTGTMELFGQDAMGRTPKQIADQLIKRSYPDATVAYEIPNASVGYEAGFGVAADVYPQNPDGRYIRLRVLVLIAVKHDYALIASAVGPFRRFGPDFGNGHPSGANLELAMDMGQYVNSFMWRGDPPR